jgi:IclR family acetate operon transcriptional repressor
MKAPSEEERESTPTRVASVARAARLLALVAATPENERTAARFARALGKPLPTVYHLLSTLVDARLLARDGNGCYHLGSAIGLLAEAYQRQSVPDPDLLSCLTVLAGETAESAYLCAWRHGDIAILASRQGTLAVRVADLRIGYYDKAHARASGKVLLAFADRADRLAYLAEHPLYPVTPQTIVDPGRFEEELETVRLQGFATEVEEFTEGVACLAVPILVGDRLLAAYTISAPAARFHHNFQAYLDSLGRAASVAAAAVLGEAPVARETGVPS